MDKVLEVKNLTVTYNRPAEKIIDNVSFTLGKGQLTMLIGPNGSGKSTLIKAILGLIPYQGKVSVLGGQDIHRSYDQIGYLPQRFDFDRNLPITVSEVLAMPFAACRKHCAHKKEGPVQALRLVESESLLNQQLRNLSGGQLQRVLLARALAHAPQLLILDEPEAGVDIGAEQNLYDLLQSLTQKGITVLIASHEVELVFQYADHVLCLNRKLVCDGPPKSALSAAIFQELYGRHIGIYQHEHHH